MRTDERAAAKRHTPRPKSDCVVLLNLEAWLLLLASGRDGASARGRRGGCRLDAIHWLRRVRVRHAVLSPVALGLVSRMSVPNVEHKNG